MEIGVRAFLARLPERIWFRLAIYTALALVLVAFSWGLGGRLPEAFGFPLAQGAVQSVLEVLASSMLAVTTFSLTAMISAYGSAARGTTPRATQLLIADRTSQNALSTFLGAFVFAILGIVVLGVDGLTDQARGLLFIGAIAMTTLVVGTLLQWIHHLTTFGRVPDVIDRVERAATDAARDYARDPHLGGVAPVAVPDGARVVRATLAGSVTRIDVPLLESIAAEEGIEIHVDAIPGSYVGKGSALARVTGGGPSSDDAEAWERLRGAFLVERHRTYEQDPRLGLVALAEIGSRALSPSTNDPGTAVEALGASERVLTVLLTADRDGGCECPRVHVPAVAFEDLVEDVLRPIARDGAPLVEVGLRVQKVLAHLVPLAPDQAHRDVLFAASSRAVERAEAALSHPSDLAAVRAAADAVFAAE